ncbi:MAG: nucleoside 2-deoxyribosyltransferase [Parcubacteria group bacterium]
MKIYFAGSIRGGRDDRHIYASIIEELQKYGVVLTEHVADKNLTDQGEVEVTADYIFKRDVSWLKECDIVVSEVTTPSLGVGYEIGLAESIGKPIISLYREVSGKSLSAMISGNEKINVYKYKNIEDVKLIFRNYFNKI